MRQGGAAPAKEFAWMTKSLNNRGAGATSRKAESGTPKSRKLSQSGADTKSKLLDAAEILFAERGYDGASFRDIANEAGVHMALCTYHFGRKELLFEEVIRRRAVVLREERMKNIDSTDLTKLTRAEAVSMIMNGYCQPILKYRFGSSKQKKAYVKLISHLFNLEVWSEVLARHFKFTTELFITRMQAVLPHADKDELVNAYSHLIASLLFICSHPDRFEEFRGKRLSKRQNVDSSVSDLFKFNHLIFMSI
jgi:AcrR family transcriptional regulator